MSKIENWTLISLNGNGHYQITGQAYDDKRAFNGTAIRTSTLKSIDFENNIVQTLNSIYDLGKPADGTTQLGRDIDEAGK